jgi:3-phenylpropionate/trans-cinnamate dioxygenase ferredoxin component
MPEIRVSQRLKEGESIALKEHDQHILLCKIGGKYYAVSNICSHARVLLSKGRLRGTTITCPLHGARFDVTSGKCLGGPAFQDIASYSVSNEDNEIIIATDG